MPLKLARKKLSSLLPNEQLVDLYLKKFGTDLNPKYIEKFKQAVRKPEPEAPPLDPTSPLFTIWVTCPVCKTKGIPNYELKAKSQLLIYNRFFVPGYKGVKDYQTVDFNAWAVTVCPKCYFASPDKKNWITFNTATREEKASDLSMGVLDELERTVHMRTKMVSAAGISSLAPPREKAAVTLSYKLAMARALVEASFDTPYAYYKAGAYALKIANVQEGTPEARKAYAEAVKLLSKCYSSGNVKDPDVEFKVIYLIIAGYLKLGKPEEAGRYLTAMDRMEKNFSQQQAKGVEVKRTVFDKWFDASKDIWSLRDDPHLWDEPKGRS